MMVVHASDDEERWARAAPVWSGAWDGVDGDQPPTVLLDAVGNVIDFGGALLGLPHAPTLPPPLAVFVQAARMC